MCMSLPPPCPLSCAAVLLIFRKIMESVPRKCKDWPSLRNSQDHWGLISTFPCRDFREMSKGSYSVAQFCDNSSLIQSFPAEENPPSQPKQAAVEKGKRHHRDVSQCQECDEMLHRLHCRSSWSFPWAKRWRAQPVLPCSALRQAGKERQHFFTCKIFIFARYYHNIFFLSLFFIQSQFP